MRYLHFHMIDPLLLKPVMIAFRTVDILSIVAMFMFLGGRVTHFDILSVQL